MKPVSCRATGKNMIEWRTEVNTPRFESPCRIAKNVQVPSSWRFHHSRWCYWIELKWDEPLQRGQRRPDLTWKVWCRRPKLMANQLAFLVTVSLSTVHLDASAALMTLVSFVDYCVTSTRKSARICQNNSEPVSQTAILWTENRCVLPRGNRPYL